MEFSAAQIAALLGGTVEGNENTTVSNLSKIEEGVAGLVHISEFASEEELRNMLSLGQSYQFTITLFEPKDQRMTLSFKKKEVAK